MFQGLFLLGVVAQVALNHYYIGINYWWIILIAIIAEIITGITVGVLGNKISHSFYNLILLSIGLFPWFLNLWVSIAYGVIVAAGFLIGYLANRNSERKNYAIELGFVFFGAITGLVSYSTIA